jgi:hypothetical protein
MPHNENEHTLQYAIDLSETSQLSHDVGYVVEVAGVAACVSVLHSDQLSVIRKICTPKAYLPPALFIEDSIWQIWQSSL